MRPTARRHALQVAFPLVLAILLALMTVLVMGEWPISSVAAPSAQTGAGARTLRVLVTTTHIQDFVRNVGGERTTALAFGSAPIVIIPVLHGDDDPHDYQPTAEDARNVADADLILANGLGLEP